MGLDHYDFAIVYDVLAPMAGVKVGGVMATEPAALPVERELALEMAERMLRIRAFETQANQLYLSAKMPGLTHLYVGEEAVAVGVCSALRRDDTITSTHRGHGHCIAKGADVAPDVLRAARQGGGVLQGQGRLDAHRRPRQRQPRRERDRRRLGRNRDGRRLLGQGASAPTASRSASSARARSARGSSTR